MSSDKTYAKISGTGRYHASKAVTNLELFERLKDHFDVERARLTIPDSAQMAPERVFDEWVKNGTGISVRHFYNNEFDEGPVFKGAVESMGLAAATKAMAQANITARELDFIVFATFTESRKIPNAACTLAGMLELEVGALPISSACAGFVDGLIEAHYRIISGDFKNILVVASEKLTKVVNYKNVPTAILFGDGASAAVVSSSDKPGIIVPYSATKYHPTQIVLDWGNIDQRQLIEMNGGAKVLKQASLALKDVTDVVLQKSGYTLSRLKYLVPHQANGRIITAFAEAMGLTSNEVVDVIGGVGNVSGASIGMALDMLLRGEIVGKSLLSGDMIAMPVVAGGYTKSCLIYKHV